MNAAFSATKWTFERAYKRPAGLTNLPTLKNVSGQQNKNDTEEANQKENKIGI